MVAIRSWLKGSSGRILGVWTNRHFTRPLNPIPSEVLGQDHTEEPTVVTTDEGTNTIGTSKSNNDQNTQSKLVTDANTHLGNSEDDHDDDTE